MKEGTKKIFAIIGILMIFSLLFVLVKNRKEQIAKEEITKKINLETQKISETKPEVKEYFSPPISDTLSRITKKPFGLYVTPNNSPVPREKFIGYHTGTDFETFANEENNDVAISATCSGKIIDKRSASGYGGILVQSCTLDGAPITVVYGHLNLKSIKIETGEQLTAGDFIGNLGKGYSNETDGERKHLHLGIHKGTIENIKGYVVNKDNLSDWIDISKYLK